MKLRYLLVLPVLVVLFLVWFLLTHSGLGADKEHPPQFIQHDFIDLSRITSVSKFRSGSGHDFSGGGETCRSMKHYFTPPGQFSPEGQAYASAHEGIPPPPDGQTDIPIYSPVDGVITGIGSERTPIGKQVTIRPDHASQYQIRLFHIFLDPGIKAGLPVLGWGGTHLKAGQKIGVIGASQGTDIAIQIGGMPWNETFISYFSVMSDPIFATYQSRGATSRDDFIISREYRDAHPLQCANDEHEAFTLPSDYDPAQDEVHLSGYQPPSNSGPSGR